MRLERHRFVRLDPAAWAGMIDADPALRACPHVVDWVDRGRPLIARRPACGDVPGLIPLGLPLPPSLGKRRLAVAAAPAAVISTSPPPLLADAVAAAPSAWRRTIEALLAVDRGQSCFGGLAWEHLTGLPYLSDASDLDLLWRTSTPDAADALAAAVARIAAGAPMGIDGELVAPGGRAVQWREWASGAPQILVKARDGGALIARSEAFA